MKKQKLDVEVPIALEPATARGALTQMLFSGTHTFSIRLSLDFIPGDFAIEKDVAVSVYLARDEANVNDETRLFFEAVPSSERFPKFSGTIAVDAADRGSYLHLYGSYDPPLGKIGDVFDAVVGRRIARESAQALLVDIRERLLRHMNYSEL